MRLRQVLVNLLHNAVKFTERGRVVARRDACSATPADGVQLRFEVRDTGIGIAEDQFDSVFDAFTQVDASSTRRHGGSGLGLAIVKELAELMGGRVGVDSRLGEGSTFWFELGLKQRARRPSRRREPGADGVDACVGAHPARRGRRGEPDGRRGDARAAGLRGRRRRRRRAPPARRGAQTRYDLIFMDCHMPVMDGFEATRRIRDDEAERSGAHTPIVALTADALAGDRERCLDVGHGRLHDQAGQQRAARRGGPALGRGARDLLARRRDTLARARAAQRPMRRL